MKPTKSIKFGEIQLGDALPNMVIEMTATLVAAGAIATRDFMPVHHDRSYANAQGAPDIFMNILSDTAYCSRFLTDWAGPEAFVTKLAIRLGVPIFPGATMTYSGSVTKLTERSNDGLVEVTLVASTHLGDHVTGTATVSVPLS